MLFLYPVQSTEINSTQSHVLFSLSLSRKTDFFFFIEVCLEFRMKSLLFTFQVSALNFQASLGLQQTCSGLRFVNQSKPELFDLSRSSEKRTIYETKDVGFVCTVHFDHARSTQWSVLFQVLSDNEVYSLLAGRITEFVGLFSPFEEILLLESAGLECCS